MSIVAISETLGSLGQEIGHRVAAASGYAFADREIVTRAAERFHEGVVEVTHGTEERPTLWERLTDSQHRYMTYVEAVLLDLAFRDEVVLLGRAAALILRGCSNVVRVRVDAPVEVRAARLKREQGLTREAALDSVHQSDRERSSRIKFLYHVDWHDPLHYDLVINTDRVDAEDAVRHVLALLGQPRFRTTAEAQQRLGEMSVVAQAKATLLADPLTRDHQVVVTTRNGVVTLSGSVRDEDAREAAARAVAAIPGVARVENEIVSLHVARNLAGRI